MRLGRPRSPRLADVASLPVRSAILVIALAVLAWSVLSIRALELDAEGRAITARAQAQRLSATEIERGLRAFDRAGRFNPDKTPALHEAFLLLIADRAGQALAVTAEVVRDEPDNRDAWTVLLRAAQALEARAIEARAARALREIDPRNAPGILGRRDRGG